MEVKQANHPYEILHCFDVLHELRPHLKKETMMDLISGMMTRGYKLLYIEEDGNAVCAAGYRFSEHLAWGKAIYIDDLSTLPKYRGKGYGSKLLDYIFETAKNNACDQVHLDSGTIPARYGAHRLYLKKGFNITSHHFAFILESK